MIKYFMIVFLLMVACGGPPPNDVKCATPKGLYHYTVTQRSLGPSQKDCPAIAPYDLTLPSAISTSCQITAQSTSADNCSTSMSYDCAFNTMEIGTITTNGNVDGNILTGTINNSTYDATTSVVICEGSYDFVAHKIHN